MDMLVFDGFVVASLGDEEKCRTRNVEGPTEFVIMLIYRSFVIALWHNATLLIILSSNK